MAATAVHSKPHRPDPDHSQRGLPALLRDALLAFLFPDSCIACGAALAADRRHLCAPCRSELRARPGSLDLPEPSGSLGAPEPAGSLDPPGSRGPREPASAAARVFYALEFEGAARAMIHALKYQGRTSVARDLARLAAPAALQASGTPPDVVVPIPLHAVRFRERGFNQSELLAEHLAAGVGAPVRRALVRARHTPPQAQLTRRQRLAIARGTFRAPDGIVECGRVLLVDDVATTGATLAAASLELLRAGAVEVVCFALAGTAPGGRAGRASPTRSLCRRSTESG